MATRQEWNVMVVPVAAPACFDESDWQRWYRIACRDGGGVSGGFQHPELAICVDCDHAYALQMRAEGKCVGRPGVVRCMSSGRDGAGVQ